MAICHKNLGSPDNDFSSHFTIMTAKNKFDFRHIHLIPGLEKIDLEAAKSLRLLGVTATRASEGLDSDESSSSLF